MNSVETIQNQQSDTVLGEHLLKNKEEVSKQLWTVIKSLRTLTSLALKIEEDYHTGYDLVSLLQISSERIHNIEAVFSGEELKEEVTIIA